MKRFFVMSLDLAANLSSFAQTDVEMGENFSHESGCNQYSGSYSGESITVGLYDSNDNLIEKFNMWLDRDKSKGCTFLNTRNAVSMSNPVGQKGKVKKIFKYLQGNSGYVRIVAAR